MTVLHLEPDLRALVAELAELEPDEVGLDVPFADVGIDSLLAMEIAVHVERRHGVRFSDGDIATIRTLRDLADLVLRHRDG